MRGSSQESSTPYCRCRVLYLGSAVPHASKEGLLGVQEPLRELYPEQGALGARGIDSWLSVWSNGLLLENVDEHRKKVTRFFPIESLHYCAAVRHVKAGAGPDAAATTRFFPLDSPFARTPSANHPPLFAAVLRRTTGIKVLECHAFICKRDMAANALVRCCFHAYADSRFAKGLEPPPNAGTNNNNNNDSSNSSSPTTVNHNNHSNDQHHYHQSTGSLYHTLGGSSTTLAEAHNNHNNQQQQNGGLKLVDGGNDDDTTSLVYNGDENHKVWARGRDELDGLYQEQGTMRSTRGSRLRQMIAPPPPPPPPPSQPLMGTEEPRGNGGKKPPKSKLQKRSKHRQEDQQLQMQPVYANGHPHPHPHHHHHHHHTLGHPARQGGPGYHPHHPQSRSVAGTLARPAPILLVPAATLPRKLHHHPLHPPPPPHRAIRAAAPIVPLYAPLPVVPPVPPTVIYGYGTTGNRGHGRRHNLHLVDQQQLEYGSSLGLHQSRRMAASHADLSSTNGPVAQHAERASPESPDNNNESHFGTGIYRRKGHLNERAFSYSIRAEHRSRSHGSLASLGFAGQQPQQQHHQNGGVMPKEEKKDREMAHLVAGLSLDDGLGQRNGNYHPQPLPRPKAR